MKRNLLALSNSEINVNFKRLKCLLLGKSSTYYCLLKKSIFQSSLDGIIPYESWYGFKQKAKHLQFFGSVFNALLPKEKITKLESRRMECITKLESRRMECMMLGYSKEMKRYHI